MLYHREGCILLFLLPKQRPKNHPNSAFQHGSGMKLLPSVYKMEESSRVRLQSTIAPIATPTKRNSERKEMEQNGKGR
jgi:hypothetical protein